MNKKISVGITISLMIIAAALTFILTSNFTLNTINKKVSNVTDKDELYKKIGEIDTAVKENFYGTINKDDVLDAVAEGYLTVLGDKYAHYNSYQQNEELKMHDEGTTIGLGMNYSPDESGYIKIDSVMPNSPASIEDIKPDTLIVEVNGESVISLGYDNAIKAIAGDIGTEVRITLRNDGEDREVALTRSEIEIRSVNLTMLEDIALIKISEFNYKTKSQFDYALQDAQSNGAKAIIFDLRNNDGGQINSCLEILDSLLPEGVIATSTDKTGTVSVLKESDSQQLNLPSVTLINSRTASTAELFAAAMRDYDKTTIVGTTSYGKGVIQDTYTLSDGSSITFTTGTFQTPKTKSINDIGIKPDYEVAMTNDSAAELETLDQSTDIQLKKALEVVRTLIE